MGFGSLRVINEDIIQPSQGFPTHGHRDMEIITFPMTGALDHKDSTGGEGRIRAGEIQKMSAGKGIRHSEYNALDDQSCHLYQIWIEPNQTGVNPYYEQRDFSELLNLGDPTLLVSPGGDNGSLRIFQDAHMWGRRFLHKNIQWNFQPQFAALESSPAESALSHSSGGVWIQVTQGQLRVTHLGDSSKNGELLEAGDAAFARGSKGWILTSQSVFAEALVFDLKT